jgi:YidC/Oxa1 family membrane protein insertase
MVILLVWQTLMPKRALKPAPVQTSSETTQVPAQSSQPIAQPTITTSQIAPITETEIILENEKCRIVFSGLGGTIKSVFLKKYQAELVPSSSHILETKSASDSLRIQNWSIVYQDDSTIVFQNFIKKTYRLHQDYTLSLKIEGVSVVIPDYRISFESGLARTEANKKDELKHFNIFYQTPLKTNKLTAAKLKPTTLSDVKWIGLKSKYFTTILSAPSNQAIVNAEPLADGRIGYIYKPPANTVDYTLYFGPLDYDILKSYKLGWEALNDLGWTKIFSIVILKIIKFLYSIFKNYGIAIIIFSFLIKAIFFPLSRMSTKQMQQMQMLQPKINELKKKYKDDAQALNRETMQLYRLYKINPFSGCLPLIFQLPIFWALYSVLQKTIELRQAGFVFWLKDLSLKDPYYILPILMGVSFLVQNFLTSADKKNMALLIFMPIFLTVIFLNFPSGLQLYWFLFNLLSIVESIISRGGIKWKKQKTLTTNPT